MSIATELQTLRNTLKNKIENKFNTTCSKSTIIDLIGELNTNIGNEQISFEKKGTNISERIYLAGDYLAKVLNTANITASADDGFTTLINKIDNITVVTSITPSISLSRSNSNVSSGSSVTLTVTITGDEDHGTPTGSVEFYEGNSNTPFRTVTTPSNTTESTSTFKTTRTHTVSSTTTYTFYAKYIPDTDDYSSTEKSTSVTVKWTYTAPSDDNVTVSMDKYSMTYGDYVTITATGTGSIKLGTSSGASDITTLSSSGTYKWYAPVGTYTVYATSTGNSTVNGKTASTSSNLTVGKADGEISLTINPNVINLGSSTSLSATGLGTISIGDGGVSGLATGTGSASVTYTPTKGGEHTIYAKSTGDSNHYSETTSKSLGVYTSTVQSNASSSVSYGGKFSVTLKDSNGNALPSGLSVKIYGVRSDGAYENTYNVTTDGNGVASTPSLNFDWGNGYSISWTVTFNGSGYYYGTGSKTYANVPYYQS